MKRIIAPIALSLLALSTPATADNMSDIHFTSRAIRQDHFRDPIHRNMCRNSPYKHLLTGCLDEEINEDLLYPPAKIQTQPAEVVL